MSSHTTNFKLEPNSWISNLDSLTKTLRRCGKFPKINPARSLHALLIKQGLGATIFIANDLIAMYSDLGLYTDAQNVFDEMPERNVVSWTSAISCHTRAGNPAKALRIFNRMLHCGEDPNSFTFSAALKACAVTADFTLGKYIHECVTRAQLKTDIPLMNALLDMYIKCGRVSEARRVFDGLSVPNCNSWNTMIAGYCRGKGGDMSKAEDLFSNVPDPDAASFNTMIAGFVQTDNPRALHYVRIMHGRGVRFDSFTFSSALKICGCLQLEKLGMQIHSYVIRAGFELDCYAGPSLIDMYGNCGQMDEASKLFFDLKHRTRFRSRLPILNSMVSTFAINRYDKPALDLLYEFHSIGVRLDAYTLSSALKVCTSLQNVKIGMQVHGLVITSGYYVDHIVGTAIIALYAKCGNLKDGVRMFRMLPHKDVIAWAALLTGYVQHGWNQSAFSLFRDMFHLNIEVDHFITSCILKACAVLAWFQGGKQVHTYSIKGGYASERIVVASLIDMYSKCGEIEDSLRVFESMTEKDIVCWTGIIVGCGYNGRAKEALEIFQDMLKSGEKPNEITFIGVLSACRHAGLDGEACMFFKTMVNEHGLIPIREHYSCMVDSLSRAGRYEEAKQLVSDMPYARDKTLRTLLLNSGAEKLPLEQVPVSPHDTPGLVALSNAYASRGMWDTSAKFREMSCRVGIKEAGKSWIEIGT